MLYTCFVIGSVLLVGISFFVGLNAGFNDSFEEDFKYTFGISSVIILMSNVGGLIAYQHDMGDVIIGLFMLTTIIGYISLIIGMVDG